MVFASLTFIYIFLPVFLLVYYLFKKSNYVLLVFSILFYALGEPVYVLLLLGVSYINYIITINIDTHKEKRIRKNLLILSVVLNITILFIFKYLSNFSLFLFKYNIISFVFNIALPIGISFYIFQTISYVVDVYRGDCKCQKSYLNLLLYISMFPQLIAGPIVVYKDVEEQIVNRKVVELDIFYGIKRITFGLAKKVVISNQLSLIVSNLFGLSKSGNILAIFLFSLQVYFDFSGYSDIAIGIGRMIGFKFNENFNYPFMSTSLSDFWRKWHISLTSFFKNYVYIPLGGNRKNQYLNIFIVWFLTGIWHGATFNFVLWGLFLAVFMILEKILSKYICIKNKITTFLGFIYQLIIVTISFSFFYFDNISDFKRYYYQIFSLDFINYETQIILVNNICIIILSLIFITPIYKIINDSILASKHKYLYILYEFTNTVVCIFLLVLVTVLLIGETNNPFIYFRF